MKRKTYKLKFKIKISDINIWNYFFFSHKLKLSKEEKLSMIASTIYNKKQYTDFKTIIIKEILLIHIIKNLF